MDKEEIKIREKYNEENEDLAKENADTILDLESQLNDALIEQNRMKNEQILADDEAAAKKRQELLNSDEANLFFDSLERAQTRQARLLEERANQTEDEEEKQALLQQAAKEREKAE